MIVLLMLVLQAEVVDKSVDDVRLGRCFDISVVDREKEKKEVYWLLLGWCDVELVSHTNYSIQHD